MRRTFGTGAAVGPRKAVSGCAFYMSKKKNGDPHYGRVPFGFFQTKRRVRIPSKPRPIKTHSPSGFWGLIWRTQASFTRTRPPWPSEVSRQRSLEAATPPNCRRMYGYGFSYARRLSAEARPNGCSRIKPPHQVPTGKQPPASSLGTRAPELFGS